MLRLSDGRLRWIPKFKAATNLGSSSFIGGNRLIGSAKPASLPATFKMPSCSATLRPAPKNEKNELYQTVAGGVFCLLACCALMSGADKNPKTRRPTPARPSYRFAPARDREARLHMYQRNPRGGALALSHMDYASAYGGIGPAQLAPQPEARQRWTRDQFTA